MDRFGKKIEITANIAIIVVSILIGYVLVQKYLFRSNTQVPPTVPIGKKLSLPDVDWAKNGRTLLLVLQDGCHYCSESAPFYQRLVGETHKRNISVVAVFPQSAEVGRSYLNNLKISVNAVKQVSLKSIGVLGTPTLLLVNRIGEVVSGWIGKLPSEKEAEVTRSLDIPVF